jgi:hypothetical protein
MDKILDLEACKGCDARKMCNAIVPNGPWPAEGASNTKPCPALLGPGRVK